MDRSSRIRTLRKRGCSQSDIARELQLSRQRVHQLFQAMRLKGGWADRVAASERRKQLPALIRQGMCGADLARHFGVSTAVIYVDARNHLTQRQRERLRANTSSAMSRMKLKQHGSSALSLAERRKKIPSLIRRGLSGVDLAHWFGCSTTTIYRDLARLPLDKQLREKRMANTRVALTRPRQRG